MSYKDVTAGFKVARAKSARFIKSTKGTPGIEVVFEFEEPSTHTIETLNWQGWLSPASKKNTEDRLKDVMGCNGSRATDANGIFTDPNFLDYKREVQLDVQLEEQRDTQGVPKTNQQTGEVMTAPRIKWVNKIGGSAYEGCTPEVVTSELDSIGFFGDNAKGSPKPIAEADIPF